jgi:hypothetical protein
MNRLLLFMACLPLGLPTVAENVNDTIEVNNPRKVVIRTNDSVQTVEVVGSETDNSYHYKNSVKLTPDAVTEAESHSDWVMNVPFMKKKENTKKNTSSFQVESGNIGFGFVSPMNAPQAMNTTVGKSYEFFIEKLLSLNYAHGKNSYSIGIGINWKNFMMRGSTRYFKNGDNVVLGAYPNGASPKSSRLRVFSWTVPMMYNRLLGHRTSFSVGPIININTGGLIKTIYYDENGKKVVDKDHNINQTPVTVDFKAAIDLWYIGFYVKYSPFNVLKTAYGPKFQSLSFGIQL